MALALALLWPVAGARAELLPPPEDWSYTDSLFHTGVGVNSFNTNELCPLPVAQPQGQPAQIPKHDFNISGDWVRSSPYEMQPDATDALPDPLTLLTTDKLSALNGPAEVTTLLVDGQYKPYSHQRLMLQPFVTGGVGLAVLDQGGVYASSVAPTDREYLPLYRVGGGLSYDLEENFGFSLSYRASFAQDSNSSNTTALIHDPSQINTQIIDVGMNYRF